MLEEYARRTRGASTGGAVEDRMAVESRSIVGMIRDAKRVPSIALLPQEDDAGGCVTFPRGWRGGERRGQ